MINLLKASIQDLVKHAYRNSPKITTKTAKAVVVENFDDMQESEARKKTPTIYVIDSGDPNEKNEFDFPESTKKFTIKARKAGFEILYNYNETDFDNNIYATIICGEKLIEDNLDLDNKTIFFKTSTANLFVEILVWT